MSAPPIPATLVLSLRAAGKLLATDRGTVAELVRRGLLRAVPWGATRRVPLAELERLASVGWALGSTGRPRRPPGRRRPADAADPVAALRAVRVEDL